MRRWLAAASGSARDVSERPVLWLPGALAWVASVGRIPFLVAVGRPPSQAELTFLGARLVTSGAWPMNAVLIVALATTVVLLAFVLVAAANAVLLDLLEQRTASVTSAARLLRIALVAALPAAVLFLLLLILAASIAPGAFNAPDDGDGGPVLTMILGLAPIVIGLVVVVVLGAAFAAVAGRTGDVRGAGRRLARIGGAGWAHVLCGTAVHAAFLVLAALLLGVLWEPIGAQLGVGGDFDVATGLLLVGFVAVWLCLVLVGGALHAWSATTWSRLLAAGPRSMPPQRT
jgi:hypothetical protein